MDETRLRHESKDDLVSTEPSTAEFGSESSVSRRITPRLLSRIMTRHVASTSAGVIGPLVFYTVMESIKVGATKRINRARGERGLLWQPRYFDRPLRTVREYHEKVGYIHLNSIKAGLVRRPEDWPWSSVHEYGGNFNDTPVTPSGLCIDRVWLPADQRTRI